MLVLDDAPLDATVSGALWAAFAGAGRHPAAVGRLVVAPGPAEPLLDALVAGAQRLRVGDPQHADTEVGPLASHADLEAVERLVAEAEAGGAERLCGGPLELPGLDGAFCAPVVLRGVREDARLMREMPPGPGARRARGRARTSRRSRSPAEHADAAVSVWTDDRRARRAHRALARRRAGVGERARPVGAVGARPARPPRRAAAARVAAARACAAPAGSRTTRRSSARARPPRGCCTAARASGVAALREGALPVARVALRAARAAVQRRTGRDRTARARPATARRSRPGRSAAR